MRRPSRTRCPRRASGAWLFFVASAWLGCEGGELSPTTMVSSSRPPPAVGATPPPTASARTTTTRLKVATWNVAWMRAEPGKGVIKRTTEDFARLAEYARALDADVIALQEIAGEDAAARLFDPEGYALEVEPGNDVQRVGFAIRRSLAYERHPDLRALDLGRLRAGVDVSVVVPGGRLRLLAVHLKSGCFGPALDRGDACEKLIAQLPVLEEWIDARAREPEPFLVLGDFNRRLSADDPFWRELDDGDPPNADLLSVNEGLTSPCWQGAHPRPIDHVVLDRRAATFLVPGSRVVHEFDAPGDQAQKATLSDHCALSVELELRSSASPR